MPVFKQNKVIGTRGQGEGVWCPRELTTEHLTEPGLQLYLPLCTHLGLWAIPSLTTVKVWLSFPSSNIDSWSLAKMGRDKVDCTLHDQVWKRGLRRESPSKWGLLGDLGRGLYIGLWHLHLRWAIV